MLQIKKYEHRLSDGRELIYYDDGDTKLTPNRNPDRREPIPRAINAKMRQDPLTGEWVSIAPTRQNRAFLPPPEFDPLAPATESNPSEVPSLYDVAVFENKSPSFGPCLEANGPHGLEELTHIGLGRELLSVGRCEVVCFSPERTGSFGTLSPSRARTVIECWVDRTAVLSAMSNIQQVFPFENRGEVIGVTLHHPHGQIYAYPYITPRTCALLRSLDAYGPNLFEDILKKEKASERLILSGQYWTAFVPFAARWPIEIHVLPNRHVADFTETTGKERDELAIFYLRLLRGVDALYDSSTPYIAAWHQSPVNCRRDQVRLMLQITSPRRAADKLKYLAGSEAAMGAWIGDICPELSAQNMREAIKRADAQNPVGTLPKCIKGIEDNKMMKMNNGMNK